MFPLCPILLSLTALVALDALAQPPESWPLRRLDALFRPPQRLSSVLSLSARQVPVGALIATWRATSLARQFPSLTWLAQRLSPTVVQLTAALF